MEEHNTDQSTEGLKINLKNRKEMICDFALSYIEHLESELEKLTVMRCSTELKDKYKTDFENSKVVLSLLDEILELSEIDELGQRVYIHIDRKSKEKAAKDIVKLFALYVGRIVVWPN